MAARDGLEARRRILGLALLVAEHRFVGVWAAPLRLASGGQPISV
jgi:hypothetical protein